jgi:hypothetical protein
MLSLFKPQTISASQMLDKLTKLRTTRAQLMVQLSNVDNEIAPLEESLNQFINPQAAAHTQPVATIATSIQVTTQANANKEQYTHKPITQPVTLTKTINKPLSTINIPTKPIPTTQLASSVNCRQAQYATTAAPKQAAPVSTTVPGMEAMVGSRARYHTEQLQITSVVDTGVIEMYNHYLGNGVSPLEGYAVTDRVSAAGKAYKLMAVPALKITCTLAQPLPEGMIEKKNAISEWLEANEYLRSDDPVKFIFETEYDKWGHLYSPYLSIDSIGCTLYIRIGAASLDSPQPWPTMIA